MMLRLRLVTLISLAAAGINFIATQRGTAQDFMLGPSTSKITPTPYQPAPTYIDTTRNQTAPPYGQPAIYDRALPYDQATSYGSNRIQTARNQANRFREIAQVAPAVAATLAGENANFVERWASLAETYDRLATRLRDARAKFNTTQNDYNDVRTKLDHYGLTPTVGLLLRHKKEQLDAWQASDSANLLATDELARSRQQQLEFELVRYDGSDPAAQATELLAAEGFGNNQFQRGTVASQVEELLYQRSQWLASLRQGYRDYQQALGELDSITNASAKLMAGYRRLIDQHIIWIRSGDAVSAGDVRKLSGAASALLDDRRSANLGESMRRKWAMDTAGGIGMLSLVLAILIGRWTAKSWLVGIGGRKRMREATDGSRKVAAGLLTTVVAATLPGILFVFARWLGDGFVTESTLQSSAGFYAASLVALLIELVRQLIRSDGYLARHVAVELPNRQRASAYITLIGFGLILAAYVVTMIELVDRGTWRDSGARFGFITAMLLVAWTMHLALRPTGGFLEPLIAKFGGSVIHHLRFVIYLGGVGFGIAMVVLSALGYGFTAGEIVTRGIITLVALMVAATWWSGIKIMSSRGWHILTGTTPMRRFDQYGEIKSDPVSGVNVPGVLAEHYLELKHQLAFLCQCALVVAAIVGVGWLWIDVFPNVRLGNPVVWTVQDAAETNAANDLAASGTFVSDSNVAGSFSGTTTRPITVLHLLMAAATMFVAFQLAKLLPALFDALVLQRVSFDEGMEHFTLVLVRTVLFGIGCLIACNWIGLRWQTIQWLAVGLTIGLGFGLQDMVRNLFGGVVVLFEKPARLGDLITVGKFTGRVASQKFRTTVLSDDEGREVIIPNKNFVSEEVVNWMGAGRLHVIPIEVAVTRDQRPADICRLLQELVIGQPDVLLTPAPQATLVCVAKNSQRIEVRAWIENRQDATRYRESLHKLVTKFLRENQWLAAEQPTQPSIRSGSEDGSTSPFRAATHHRKRSA